MGRRGWCGGISGFAKQARYARIDMNEKVLHVQLLPGDRLRQRVVANYAIIELERDGKRKRIYSILFHASIAEGNRVFRTLLMKLAEAGNDEDRAWVAERVLEWDHEEVGASAPKKP